MPQLFLHQNTARVLAESNRIGIQFLRTELETGHTMLDVFETSEVESTRNRSQENAGKVYDLVTRLIPRLDLSARDEKELQQSLGELKRRLDCARAP
jgi:hypothetical protein